MRKNNTKARKISKHNSIPSQNHSLNTRNKSNKRSDLADKRALKEEEFGTLIMNEYHHKFAKSPTVQKQRNFTNKISVTRKNVLKSKKMPIESNVYVHRKTPKSKLKGRRKEMYKNNDILTKSHHPVSNTDHNIYSSKFLEGPRSSSQANSMIFPQRPASNSSMTANTEYTVSNKIETSQNSLRQDVMSEIKKSAKANMDPVLSIQEGGTPLDTRFTKSLQIQSPSSKFSHRESQPAVKSPARRLYLKYKTSLHGHKNTVNSLAFDTKYYSHLFSGSHDYSIKIWH